jgi:hypothetical protein
MMKWGKLAKLADTNPLADLRVEGPQYDDPVFLIKSSFRRYVPIASVTSTSDGSQRFVASMPVQVSLQRSRRFRQAV